MKTQEIYSSHFNYFSFCNLSYPVSFWEAFKALWAIYPTTYVEAIMRVKAMTSARVAEKAHFHTS